MNNKKWVIGVDLDGTTLMKWDGRINEEGRRLDRVHPLTREAFSLMQEQGHHIILDTGRNSWEAELLYKDLGLNSYMINSAGAQICNPSDNSKDIITGMSNKTVKNILNDDKVVPFLTNWTVDDVIDTYMYIAEENEFSVNGRKFWKVTEFDGEFDFDPQSAVIYLKLNKEETFELAKHLRELYGDEIHVTYWGTQVNGEMNGIEFNPAKSNKGTALLTVADQLGIPHSNTMSFGDGENDIAMLKMAEVGVVMKNAESTIKHLGNATTELTNEEGGVGDFLIKYFNLK